MRLSQVLFPTLKENPAEAQIASHRLMLRAGMIRQVTSGIYSWLPLGLKVLKNIENIVREEMQAAHAQEILMPTIQPAELWHESGRYDSYGKEMLRMEDRHGRAMLYGPTNEEVVTDIFRQNVKSYKQLPQCWYHIQWKFRDEIRPRFGVMRGREFLMKDAYSFDASPAAARESYAAMFAAYLRIFKRLGVTAIPLKADTGAIGGDLSHEFHILADTGESGLFYDAALEEIEITDLTLETATQYYAATEDLHNPQQCPVPEKRLKQRRGIEVGHIFYLGDKYSTALNAMVTQADGSQTPAVMGCYGIGVSRLVGAIIEAHHDAAGIVWPESVAPFTHAVINLRANDVDCTAACEKIYQRLLKQQHAVVYDDRDCSAGAKFADIDLLGVPQQIIVGPKGLKSGMVEVRQRHNGEKQEQAIDLFF